MLDNLFAHHFAHNLKREKHRIIREARGIKRSRMLKEDSLSDALDTDDLGDSQGISDALGDIESKAAENKAQEVKLQKYIDKHNAQTNEIIIEWIQKLDDFASFVNDPTNDSSIKSILDSALAGSVLEKAGKAEYRQLTKVAQAISGLSQSLRAYVIGGKETKKTTEEPEEPEQASEEMPEAEEEEFMEGETDVNGEPIDSEM